jgi:hypothetical protein
LFYNRRFFEPTLRIALYSFIALDLDMRITLQLPVHRNT